MAIVIKIDVDEKGSVRAVKDISRELDTLGKKGEEASGGVSRLSSGLGGLKTALGAVGAAYAASKIAELGVAALNVSSGFERMKISLNTITKGRGEEWFNKLNQWAIDMPVNTEKAIQTFTMLRAMGLEPTIKDMTTLVDTTSALGGQADALNGIARALGQIQTKGKVSAEELMQLAERGIPAYEILKEKFNLTAEQVGNIGNQAIDANAAVQALLQGMEDRFGGQSAKIMDSYSGIIESIRSNWIEWIRVVMDTGPFEGVKTVLKEIRDISESFAKGAQEQSRIKQAGEYLRSIGIDPMIQGDVTTGAPDIWGKEQLAIFDQRNDALEKYKNWLDEITKSNNELSASQIELNGVNNDGNRIMWEMERIQNNYVIDREKNMKLQEQQGIDLMNQQQLIFDEYSSDLDRKAAANDQFISDLEDFAREQERINQQMTQSVVNFGQRWGDAIWSAMDQGGNALENFGKMFERMIARMAVQATASGIFNMLTGGIAGGFQGGFTAGLSNALGLSGKAAGGPVMAGNAYVVGERGPELFIPNVRGKIVPNNQITNNNSSNVSVNVSVNRMTAREFDDMIENSRYMRGTA